MSEQDQNNHEPTTDFVSYYQKEMHRNIAEVRKITAEMVNGIDPTDSLREIKKIGMAMCDLAMVYGFEDEEVIGRQIVSTADSYNQEESLEGFISNLEKSANSAEEMMLYSKKDKHKSSAPEPEAEKDSHYDEIEDDDNGELDTLLFDIKEDENLFSIVNDIDSGDRDSNSEINSNSKGVESFVNKDEDHPLGFDIPESDDTELKVSFTELDDVMEIEFSEKPEVSEKQPKSIFKKITRLFSSNN